MLVCAKGARIDQCSGTRRIQEDGPLEQFHCERVIAGSSANDDGCAMHNIARHDTTNRPRTICNASGEGRYRHGNLASDIFNIWVASEWLRAYWGRWVRDRWNLQQVAREQNAPRRHSPGAASDL